MFTDNLVSQIGRDFTIGVDVADTPEALSAIHRPSCAAVVWRRKPMMGFQRWVDDLDPAILPHGQNVQHRTKVPTAMRELCEIAGTPPCAERDQLIDDVTALSEMFAQVMNAGYLRLRLEAVTTNACRKFHIDRISARLVCTYRGTGTQYGTACDGAGPTRIFTTPTGAPILLRGTLWPEQPASGLLHRSPPIEGTGETRLVLVVDPIFDPEDET